MSALPQREGVGASALTLPPGHWPSLLAFLAQHFPAVSLQEWEERFAESLVLDEQGQPLAATAPYCAGQRVHYYRALPPEPLIPFEVQVLHHDEHLLVADKPHFLPVMPAGRFLQETLLVRLNRALQLPDLVPLHRLDRGTAGVLLLSVNPATRSTYQQLFAQRRIEKTYEAVADPAPDLELPLVRRSRLAKDAEHFFRMREVPGTANSETRVERLEHSARAALYRLSPVTGRQHQLRVHMAALGIPIWNDPLYPQLQPAQDDDYTRPLQLLARALAFEDPVSGKPRRFESRRQLDFRPAAALSPGQSVR